MDALALRFTVRASSLISAATAPHVALRCSFLPCMHSLIVTPRCAAAVATNTCTLKSKMEGAGSHAAGFVSGRCDV